MEVSVLSPRRSPSAPTRMDLPAPVSPLRMFRPGANLTDSLSMMAKLWTWSSSSIRLPRPVELCPQHLVEGPPVGVHDARLERRAADEDAVTRLQEERLLAVDGEHRLRFLRLLHLHAEDLVCGHHRGPVGEGKGTDRGEDER